jgi:serine/threonine-protein kinase
MPNPVDFELEFSRSIRASSGDWYQVLQTLGAGKNALAFLVMATSGRFAGVPFALKLFTRINSETSAQAFHRETEFLKNCDHPAIMRVFDDGIYLKKHPFMVVEYLPTTLRHAMQRGLTAAEKISFVLQLLSALQDLSGRQTPIAHCDIKPDNIFVKGRSCVLGDFGLIRACDGAVLPATVDDPPMPRSHRTPDLVSYWKCEKPMTVASDVFQLGLVAAELFTGVNPLHLVEKSDDKLAPIVIEPLRPIPGTFGNQISRVVEEMLKRNPNDRPSIARLIERWRTPFVNVAKLAHALEGRIF